MKLKLKRKYILASLLMTFLVGCGAMKNHAAVEFIPAAALSSDRAGVVIFSTGAPNDCVANPTLAFVYDGDTKKRVAGAPWTSIDLYSIKSEFQDHYGTVNAIVLPAGRYYILPEPGNTFVTTIKTPEFSFNVQSGETTYLGELFMTRSCALHTRFIVRDQYARDVGMASEKNPVFLQRTPVKRLFQPPQD